MGEQQDLAALRALMALVLPPSPAWFATLDWASAGHLQASLVGASWFSTDYTHFKPPEPVRPWVARYGAYASWFPEDLGDVRPAKFLIRNLGWAKCFKSRKLSELRLAVCKSMDVAPEAIRFVYDGCDEPDTLRSQPMDMDMDLSCTVNDMMYQSDIVLRLDLRRA